MLDRDRTARHRGGGELLRGPVRWDFENVATAGAPVPYFIGRLRGKDVAAVAPQPDGAPRAAMWNSFVWVDSADETAAKAKEAGGRVLAEPFDVGDAGRMAVLADPSGAVLSVWQAMGPGRPCS